MHRAQTRPGAGQAPRKRLMTASTNGRMNDAFGSRVSNSRPTVGFCDFQDQYLQMRKGSKAEGTGSWRSDQSSDNPLCLHSDPPPTPQEGHQPPLKNVTPAGHQIFSKCRQEMSRWQVPGLRGYRAAASVTPRGIAMSQYRRAMSPQAEK